MKHGEEIQQESLKTTIQSAITDIEQGMYRTTLTDGTGPLHLDEITLHSVLRTLGNTKRPNGKELFQS